MSNKNWEVRVFVGFLVGTATGAAGSYFATKFTEQRHQKELKQSIEASFSNLESKMPDLFSGFRDHFSNPENELIRDFSFKQKEPNKRKWNLFSLLL